MPRTPPLRGQLRQRETCAYSRRALFSCDLSRARFSKPYPFLSSTLIGDCHPLETLSAVSLRLRLRGGVVGGSAKSGRTGLVHTRLSQQRKPAGVIGGELLSFLFRIFTNFRWG